MNLILTGGFFASVAMLIMGIHSCRMRVCKFGTAFSSLATAVGCGLGGPGIVFILGQELFGGDWGYYGERNEVLSGAIVFTIGVLSFCLLLAIDKIAGERQESHSSRNPK